MEERGWIDDGKREPREGGEGCGLSCVEILSRH